MNSLEKRIFITIKHFFSIPTKCKSLFLIHISITTLLPVLVCYIHHLQGDPVITCTKPSVFYCVLCMLHWLWHKGQHTHFCKFTAFFTIIKAMFLQVILNAKSPKTLQLKSFICNVLIYVGS
jgi:hypothetical protein